MANCRIDFNNLGKETDKYLQENRDEFGYTEGTRKFTEEYSKVKNDLNFDRVFDWSQLNTVKSKADQRIAQYNNQNVQHNHFYKVAKVASGFKMQLVVSFKPLGYAKYEEVNDLPTGEKPEKEYNIYEQELENLEKLKINLTRTYKKEQDLDKKEFLKDQLKDLDEKIKRFNKDENIALQDIVNIAQKQLVIAKELVKQGFPEQALNYVIPYNILFDIDIDSESILAQVKEIKNEILVVEEQARKKMLSIATSWLGFGIFDKALNSLIPFIGESTFVNTIFAAIDSKNKVVAGLAKKLQEVQVLVNDKINKFKSDHSKLIEELKDLQGFNYYDKKFGAKKVNYNFALQQDDEGRNTGNLVDEGSASYHKKLSESKKDLITYLDFIKDNQDITLDQEIREQQIAWIKDNINNNESIISTNEGISTQEYKDKLIAKRIADTDPQTFYRIVKKISKRTKSEIKWITAYLNYEASTDNKGNKKASFSKRYNNTLFKGQKIYDVHPTTENIDSKYTELINLPDTDIRKRYYNFIKKNLYKARKDLSPYFDDLHVTYNYIPELIEEGGMWDSATQSMINSVSQFPETSTTINRDALGQIVMEVPVYGLDQKLTAVEKSYNLEKVFDLFMGQYYNKIYKEQEEDKARIVLNFLKEQPQYETRNGKLVYEEGKETPSIKKINDGTSFFQAKYLVDANLYGKREEFEGNFGGRLYDKHIEKRLQSYERPTYGKYLNKKERKAEWTRLSSISKEDLNEAEKAYFEDLDTYKVYTFSKSVNAMIDYTRLKALAFNWFGGITESIQGITSLYTEAASGQYFNDDNLNRGYKLMIKSSDPTVNSDLITEGLKQFQLLDDFGYGTKTGKILDKGYWHLRKAERFTKGAFMLAYLDSKGILDSLYVDENGLLQSKIEPFYDAEGNSTKFKIDLTNELSQLSKRLINRDSGKNPISLNQKGFGRLLGQFRSSWLFEGVSKRFGEERDDIVLGKKVKGSYRSFGLLFKTNGELDIKGGIYKLWKYTTDKKSIEQFGLNEVDMFNIKRAYRELIFINSLFLISLILKKLSDDDDDEESVANYTFNFLINQSYRANRDLTFYLNPRSTEEVLTNIAPVQRTLSDFFKFGDAVKETIMLEPYSGEGTKNEKLKVLYRLGKITPFTSGFNSMYRTITKEQK